MSLEAQSTERAPATTAVARTSATRPRWSGFHTFSSAT